MKRGYQVWLVWAPRVAGLLFALFVSLFALDVFDAGYGFWGTVLALLIHLLPVFALLIILALAWRWPWIGVVGYGGFAIWYLLAFWGRFPWSVYLIIAGPPLLVGLLFGLAWHNRPAAQAQAG